MARFYTCTCIDLYFSTYPPKSRSKLRNFTDAVFGNHDTFARLLGLYICKKQISGLLLGVFHRHLDSWVDDIKCFCYHWL